MRDLRVKFDGAVGTEIKLDEEVTGKLLTCQKYLINTVTNTGTDAIFPSRGTSLFKSAIGGVLIDATATIHTCNFAALDTLYFCSFEEHADIYSSEEYVQNYTLNVLDYDNEQRCLELQAIFEFKDGTQTVNVDEVKFITV